MSICFFFTITRPETGQILGIYKAFERQVWRVQVAHLHKAGRASPSVDDKLRRNLSLIRGETHKKLISICFFDNKKNNNKTRNPKLVKYRAYVKFLKGKSDAYRKLICIKQRVHVRVFKFYPSVLLSMIKTCQSAREKFDSYCKIIYLTSQFIFTYFIFCLYIIYGFSLHILQQIYLKCFSLITKV